MLAKADLLIRLFYILGKLKGGSVMKNKKNNSKNTKYSIIGFLVVLCIGVFVGWQIAVVLGTTSEDNNAPVAHTRNHSAITTSNLTGTWINTIGMSSTSYTFFDDGRFVFLSVRNRNDFYGYGGTWSLSGSTLILDVDISTMNGVGLFGTATTESLRRNFENDTQTQHQIILVNDSEFHILQDDGDLIFTRI